MWSSVSTSNDQAIRTTDFPAVSGYLQATGPPSSTQLLPPPSLPTARPTFKALLAPYPPALNNTQEHRSPTPSPLTPQPSLPFEPEDQSHQHFAAGVGETACQPDPAPPLLGPPTSFWAGQIPAPTYPTPTQNLGATSGTVQQQVDADLNDLYRAGQRDLNPMSSSQIILPSPFTQYPMGLLQDRITLDEHMNGLSKPFVYPSAHGLEWHQPLPATTGFMLPPLQQLEQNIRPALTPYAPDHQPALAHYESPPYTPTPLDRDSPLYLYSPSQSALSLSHVSGLQSEYCSPCDSSPPTPITYPHPPAGSNTISPSTIAAWRAEQDRIRPTAVTGSVFASPERIDAGDDHHSPAESEYHEEEGEDELSSIYTTPRSQCAPALPLAKMGDDFAGLGSNGEVLADTNGIRYTTDAEEKQTVNVRRKCFNCAHTKPPSWRKSVLFPGMILCNKCGIYERTHRRARPRQGDDEKLRRQIGQPLAMPMMHGPGHVQQSQPPTRLSPVRPPPRASRQPTPVVPSSVPASICRRPEIDTSSVSSLASYAYTSIPTPVSSSSMNFAEIPIGPPFPTTPIDRRSMPQDPYWSIQQHRSYAVSQTPSPTGGPPAGLADATVPQPRIAPTAAAYNGRPDPYGTAYATRLAARYHAYPAAYHASPPRNAPHETGGPVRGIGWLLAGHQPACANLGQPARCGDELSRRRAQSLGQDRECPPGRDRLSTSSVNLEASNALAPPPSVRSTRTIAS